ncbi:MAG: class B sortase [Coriobacteriaceae bacterium]|jgi:sortase B|nr:class B sortase [Coriobacteriaceae bacterium]
MTNYQQYHAARPAKKKKVRKKSLLWQIIFWFALAVFLCSLTALGSIGYSYLKGQNLYKDVASWGFIPPQDVSGNPKAELSLTDLSVDWDSLLEKNPDTVAWVYIPGTVINYPVVQGRDNQKYLTVDFLGGRGQVVTFGTIFLAAENKSDFSDPNNLIYGHHMQDGSMFACLAGFANSAEFNTHRTVYVLTPAGNYRLTTFALVISNGHDPLAQPRFSTNEEMVAYFQDKIDRNVAWIDSNPIQAADITKCFAFVTCDYTVNDGRAVLFAAVTESTVGTASGTQNSGLDGLTIDDIMLIDETEKELQ